MPCCPVSQRVPRYSSLGFAPVSDTPASHAVPYVVVDAADAISLCVRALAAFSSTPLTITCICRCIFACTHSMKHAQYAVLCGATAPLKLIVRDGSLGNGAVAAAAAALSHIVGNSGANVGREPMWQDGSLLDKLLFVVASEYGAPFTSVPIVTLDLVQTKFPTLQSTKLHGAAPCFRTSCAVHGSGAASSPTPHTSRNQLLPYANFPWASSANA